MEMNDEVLNKIADGCQWYTLHPEYFDLDDDLKIVVIGDVSGIPEDAMFYVNYVNTRVDADRTRRGVLGSMGLGEERDEDVRIVPERDEDEEYIASIENMEFEDVE